MKNGQHPHIAWQDTCIATELARAPSLFEVCVWACCACTFVASRPGFASTDGRRRHPHTPHKTWHCLSVCSSCPIHDDDDDRTI